MQKRICRCLAGYIILLSLAGLGLYIHRGMAKMPLLEEAMIRELIPEATVSGEPAGKIPPGSGTVQKPASTEEQQAADYWADYRKDEPLKVASTDKLKALFLVRKNLSSQEINRIYSMAQGGITAQEQTEIKALLRQRLGSEERAELKKMILKYY